MTAIQGNSPRTMIRAMAVPVIAPPPLESSKKRACRWVMAGITAADCVVGLAWIVDACSGDKVYLCVSMLTNSHSKDYVRTMWKRLDGDGYTMLLERELKGGIRLKKWGVDETHKGPAVADEALCMRVWIATLGDVMGL